jgi:hypothetical protein
LVRTSYWPDDVAVRTVHRYLYAVIFTGGKVGVVDVIECPTAVEQYYENCGRERNPRYSRSMSQQHLRFPIPNNNTKALTGRRSAPKQRIAARSFKAGL